MLLILSGVLFFLLGWLIMKLGYFAVIFSPVLLILGIIYAAIKSHSKDE